MFNGKTIGRCDDGWNTGNNIYIMIMATLFAFEYSCKSLYALAINNWLLEIE